MTETTEKPQLRIGSAKDLRAALTSGDPAVRFSILRAIAQNPEKASSYGRHDGKDVVDELCGQVEALPPCTLRTAFLATAAAFRDRRVEAVFERELSLSQDAEVIALACRYLATQPTDDVRRLLSSLLLQYRSHVHARGVAGVMAAFADLTPAERLRIALLGNDCAPPPLDEGSGDLWLAELEGPCGPRARELAVGQGERAFALLKKRWTSLGGELKAWLLTWGAASHPAATVELVLTCLDSSEPPLVAEALRVIPRFGAAATIFGGVTQRFLVHPDAEVRRAAVVACTGEVDWGPVCDAERDPAVRLEMLKRLADADAVAAVPRLVRLIEAGDVKARAEATAALRELEGAAASVAGLMAHGDAGVRAAAAQVLVAAGEHAWLERHVLSDP